MSEIMEQRKDRRNFTGRVVSDKMDKTVVVTVERTYRDDLSKKVIRKFKKYKVHDENQEASLGDVVEIYEGRPRSKQKYMYLSKVITFAIGKQQ